MSLSANNSNSGIKDNRKRGAVGDFIREKIKDGSELSFVSAFFTIYAYEALKDSLNLSKHLRFLFGEPSFVQGLDPEKKDKKAFQITRDALELVNQLEQKRVARECAEWIKSKVDIRSVTREGFLHGKMYHISNAGVDDAILGSSNFTVRGLGLAAKQNNIELNLEVDSSRDRKDLKSWFDELWEDKSLVRDVKDEVLAYLVQLYQNHSPEFIYYKTLFHLFEDYLKGDKKTDDDLGRTTLFESQVWNMLYDFQKDGAKGAINKILRHNGCILADSVGLGKTFEALAVIKYFELRNERVLVLCPKKLRENWTIHTINDQRNQFKDDRFRYDVLSHTDLSFEKGLRGDINLETLHWENYDLVVIDESHNFRNNTPGKKDEVGNQISKSRYQRLMEDVIQKGIRTKLLLLSATPVNNNLKDLRNQIYFISAGEDGAFQESIGITNIKDSLSAAQTQFSHWSKKPAGERTTADLVSRLGADFFKLLDELTIARSRKHIKKYYKESVIELGGFPQRLKPISLSPDIDLKGRFMSYERLDEEISGYQLSLFNPNKYVLPDYKSRYITIGSGIFKQADREEFLIGMMKVNFLKRLESSVHAFALTMERTIQKIDNLEEKIKNFQQNPNQNPESDQLTIDYDEPDKPSEDEYDDSEMVGGKLKYFLGHLNLNDWLKALQKDRQQLGALAASAKDVGPERDEKLAKLKELITSKVREAKADKEGKPNKKVLVFTAFADTAKYLYENLYRWANDHLSIHTAFVCGSGDNRTNFIPHGFSNPTDFNNILINFSPGSKKRSQISTMPQSGEIDLLIATDCISEGQNLQDCDYLINYDIHWNPVRIIQRFGRIDRIGSRNESIQMVNFWPTDDLNRYINLKHRVEARMALVDISSTTDDNILKNEDIEELIHDDLKYRDKQLLRLKDEILDLEDLGESVSLTDFSLDDFRIDLMNYLNANEQILKEAPFGLYSVTPTDSSQKAIQPGVIFCLKQILSPKSSRDDTQAMGVNPLTPYFLVYILEDGNARLTFAQPKQILDVYRLLCADKKSASQTLCDLFDSQTANGSDMSHYSNLLRKALDSIIHTFKRRSAASLLSSRGGLLLQADEQASGDTEFDLVTWLVIQEEA